MESDHVVPVVRVRLAALAAMAGQGGTVTWSQAWRAIEPLAGSFRRDAAYSQPWVAIAEATAACVSAAVAESRRRSRRGDQSSGRQEIAAAFDARTPQSDRPAGFRRRCC